MPRGRHRHSPPLHRLLPPSVIAGVSLVCAFGPWLFREAAVLRVIAAIAAATAAIGAAVMRRWDAQAGKQVADLARARAGDEWRHEERVAELETDLEESRELRGKLEQKLRAKRTELAGLRNEHAALLRRYATAETERASALEGRRLLELEAAPARETDAEADPDDATDDATDNAEAVAAPAGTDVESGPASDADAEADIEADVDADADSGGASEGDSASAPEAVEEEPAAPAVFSPEGSKLFLRAQAALGRFDDGEAPEPKTAEDVVEEAPEEALSEEEPARAASESGAEVEAAGEVGADPDTDTDTDTDTETDTDTDTEVDAEAEAHAEADGDVVREDDAWGKSEAVDAHEHATAATAATSTVAKPAKPAQPSGHFTVPTAVAVVPAAPVRRQLVEGGFDFFGTQKEDGSAALDAVHNEDLADVVGEEALAVHKAESEAQFKPADERSRGAGQVIDLTAHDETEQINLHGLRSAAS